MQTSKTLRLHHVNSPDAFTELVAALSANGMAVLEVATHHVGQRYIYRDVTVSVPGESDLGTLQLAVLKPAFAILDEIDSGLDVDALRDVSRRVEAMTSEDGLGVLAITHYARLLHELRPDRVHVLMGGHIVASGGPELAESLEQTGYEGLAAELGVETLSVEPPAPEDPFADPGF